jgi:hypothetical protein
VKTAPVVAMCISLFSHVAFAEQSLLASVWLANANAPAKTVE